MPKYCDTPRRPYMFAQSKTTPVRLVFQPRCKLWTCRYCAEVNRRQWVAKAYNAAAVWEAQGKQIMFVTLTSHEKLSAHQSWYVWPRAWPKLHMRAIRQAGKGEYCMIPEQHADGRIHVHMITTWPLSKGWFKTNARACGLGYMADAEPARTPGGAAYYVNKYISKQLGDIAWPKHFHRVRTSQHFPLLPPFPPAVGWTFGMVPPGAKLDEWVDRAETTLGIDCWFLPHNYAWRVINEVS